ncbi:MAG: anthranilate phosphoribosyltransferase [Deltaproteobacteria bacterium]|nr:anthranilate phosphoribosyltransferase [Deltaproteobacteria bacterium]
MEEPGQVAAVIEELAEGHDLPANVANKVFGQLMNGELTPTQAGAFLLGLRVKGESSVEVGAAVGAILDRAVQVPPIPGPVIDVVGTGGDCKSSFNCSTATALTLAGMGHKVLKHGNRSVSSKSGSADVLEQLGIPLDIEPEDVAAKLERDNFVFLFAPKYHPAFKHVMPIRRELGVRTLFNLLGPLVNPARPTHHLLGVSRAEMLPLVAETLARKGGATGAVVCGAGGYDEVTPMGPASVIFVTDDHMAEAALDPADYGIGPCTEEELAVTGPEDAARVLREILRGGGPKPMRDMLALNVGLALYLLDDSPKAAGTEGFDAALMSRSMKAARQAVDSGAGRRFADA